MDSQVMQKQIMRRVYYSYAISIGAHVMFWQGMFLGVAAGLLAKWLHVASIVKNFLAVPVGSVPQYVYGSFWGAINHGELLTAVTLVLAGVVAISAGYHIAQAILPRMMTVKVV
jgi:hypothetical protein